jgi:hypothetical protein
MTIKSCFYSSFFIWKWTANERIIIIRIEIPSFNKFCAFAGCFVEEIDENHSQGLLNLRR